MSAFWDFSVRVYPEPDVKEACLALQAAGMDVNVGLWIVWACMNGRDPGPALGQAVALSAAWNAQVVKPLRQVRDVLKSSPIDIDDVDRQGLREQVLGAELEAEHIEQLALEPLAQACPELGPADKAHWALQRLQDYAARMGVCAETAPCFVENVFDAAKNV